MVQCLDCSRMSWQKVSKQNPKTECLHISGWTLRRVFWNRLIEKRKGMQERTTMKQQERHWGQIQHGKMQRENLWNNAETQSVYIGATRENVRTQLMKKRENGCRTRTTIVTSNDHKTSITWKLPNKNLILSYFMRMRITLFPST